MKHTGRGLGGDLIQLAFRTTKHRQSSHLDHASKTSVLNTCRKTFFGLVIIRNSRKEELGRKLRRRQREKKKTKKPNTQSCQPGDTTATSKERENSPSAFIEFQFNLRSPSPHPVVSSCPQKCAPLLPYELTIIQRRSAGVLWLRMT